MTLTLPGGAIEIAGKTVSRLGLGTMRLTGPGTWGDPDDREQALTVLRNAVHTFGITHIDTADAYGPHTVEHLINDALYPYPDHVLIATKVGFARPAPNMWAPHGHPVYLRACVEASLRRMRMERLELCYLHRIDPEVPLSEQLGTLAALRDEGKIAHIGLSKIAPEDFGRARKEITVAAVQNVLNIHDR
ncbi:aldo/keto reductase [Streptomyces olivaceus]|uniref:aldo/keto reductase n=1 Tax=Streptomyces olivaceus TaxID=47716 RepID=UPI0038308523